MSPEEKACITVNTKLEQSSWIIQDLKQLNLFADLGIAVREHPTSTSEVDYGLGYWGDRVFERVNIP